MSETIYGDYSIAIIGMACRFPSAENINKYWSLISNSLSGISDIKHHNNNSTYITEAGRLANIGYFDTAVFNLDKKEAALIDPQHRLLLEIARDVFDDAGYNPFVYKGKIGVFTSVGFNSYFVNNILKNQDIVKQYGIDNLLIKNDKSHSNTLISYKLNLKGESYNIDTACSSSLASIHLACRSLLNNDTDMVIAGGCRIIIPHNEGDYYKEGGILSPRGICSPFDNDADGSIFGSGAGMVMLKRLEDALRDKDNIYAVIVGSSSNNDGSEKIGFTAPSQKGQEEAWKEAISMSGVQPEEIGYIECHGTGTKLGDPIEASALISVFQDTTTKLKFCALGSVKANIGHLDAAAGVAGLINLVHVLKYQKIPYLKNFKTYNNNIDWKHSPFYVNHPAGHPLKNGHNLNVGAVNSLGIGGTNISMIVKSFNSTNIRKSATDIAFPIILSAESDFSVKYYKEELLSFLHANKNLDGKDIAFSLFNRIRSSQEEWYYGASVDEIINALEAGTEYKTSHKTTLKPREKLIFVYPGQASQYPNMFANLYQSNEIFKNSIDECAKLFLQFINVNISSFFDGSTLDSDWLENIEISQALIFSVEIALTELLNDYEINPDAVMGHSFGEYTAAYVAGVWSLQDTIQTICERSRLLKTRLDGGMVSVRGNLETIQKYLTDIACSISLINTPNDFIISGKSAQIDLLVKKLEGDKVPHSKLPSKIAFHSPELTAMSDQFASFLNQKIFNTPTKETYPTLIGVSPDGYASPIYWQKHCTETVDFTRIIDSICRKENVVFLEVGPGNFLTSIINKSSTNSKAISISKNRNQSKHDHTALLEGLIKLNFLGYNPNIRKYFNNFECRRVSLPTYAYEKTLCWIEPDNSHASNKSTETIAFQSNSFSEESAKNTSLEENAIVEKINSIWSNYFSDTSFTINDDYFDIGGDSLTATMILTQIRDHYSIRLTLDEFFEAGNIFAISKLINSKLV